MPSRETAWRRREPLRRARSVASECLYISRMADGHFTTSLSKEFGRVRGISLGGNFVIHAPPGRGRPSATPAEGGISRRCNGIIHLLSALLRLSRLRIPPQGSAGSTYSWQRSGNKASTVIALWRGFVSDSRAEEGQEEVHPLGDLRKSSIITAAVATAIGGQKQHHCKPDNSWRLVVRVRERRGFLPSALSFSPWAARRSMRASMPTSQFYSPNCLMMRKSRWRHLQCHQPKRKGTQQRRSHCWKTTAKGRNLCNIPRHLWGLLLQALPRKRGRRCGKALKKDMAGHTSWRIKAYVRRLRHIWQTTVHPPPAPRTEAISGNLILHNSYVIRQQTSLPPSSSYPNGLWSSLNTVESMLVPSILVRRPCVGSHVSILCLLL